MKIKIKQSNNDKKITIPFGNINNLLGYDDDIQSLISTETNNSINNVSDFEVKEFQNSSNGTQFITFHFWNGVIYQQQLAPLDFAANSLTASSSEARNSFYVIQIFDSFNEDTQTKLHTGYFNGYDFLKRADDLETNYKLNNISEFSSYYINNSFFEGMSGVVTLYAKFFFYSAKSTKFYPFSRIQNPTKVEDIYIPLTFNLTTYKYSYPTINVNFYEITNPNYATLVNNTVNSIPIQKTAYPTGNTFTSDGIYINQ